MKRIAGDVDARGMDSTLLVLAGLILVIGLIMVSSASISLADKTTGSPFYFLTRQLMFLLMGAGCGVLMYNLPLAWWQRSGYLLLMLAFALLLMVLVPGIGRRINGSMRWVAMGSFHLQVSEVARLLIFVYLAGYIVRRGGELASGIKGFLKPMGLIGVAGLMLLMEPDFGATLVLTTTTMAMLFLGGARLKDFGLCAAAAALAAVVLVLASPYRLARLTGFMNPWQDPFDTGFQLTNSLIAIGQGQLFGVGLGESVQKLFYLPEAHTDFVFAVTAEEFGLMGSLAVIGLYLALTWRALLLARRAAKREQLFGAYLAFGIGIWIGLQAFINMGVNMGVLPTKGLTLPLMSYGGSSLIVSCAAIGLLMRVDRETRESGKWKSDADEVAA
ncbi:MAG TPA: putative lipid II flippase FtsW [Gammaproteobacteria bacterium]|jgi:cell division protein FtsW|nr:putative lipid II flippase FtsW [Gammaproteobacteria bacterium]